LAARLEAFSFLSAAFKKQSPQRALHSITMAWGFFPQSSHSGAFTALRPVV
jgi:hypothetical protein